MRIAAVKGSSEMVSSFTISSLSVLQKWNKSPYNKTFKLSVVPLNPFSIPRSVSLTQVRF